MGRFVDPAGGLVAAQDVIIHYDGQPDSVLPTGSGGGGGAGTGNVNLIQVGGNVYVLGPDSSIIGANSLGVVFPTGYTMGITGNLTAAFLPATSGGTSLYHRVVTADVIGQVVKNSPGQVYGIEVGNTSAVPGFLHLYDSATAPIAGAGTIKKTLFVPGPLGGGGGGNNYYNMYGAQFVNGISYTFTVGTIADSDVAVPLAATYSVDMDFK